MHRATYHFLLLWMWWIDHHCTLCSCFYFFYIFCFSFILKCFSCREHLSQNQMFIFIQIGSCVSSLKWCSSGSLCKQMCCDWKTLFNNWVKYDESIWNLSELLKQHWRLWFFLWKYNFLDFALQIYAKVMSGNLSKVLCRLYDEQSLHNAKMGGVMLKIINLLLN